MLCYEDCPPLWIEIENKAIIQDFIILNFQKLQELDDDLKEQYLELITRYYLLFENIYQYVIDLNAFVEQLNDQVFIQQNIESILKDVEGKQLLVSTYSYPYLV